MEKITAFHVNIIIKSNVFTVKIIYKLIYEINDIELSKYNKDINKIIKVDIEL